MSDVNEDHQNGDDEIREDAYVYAFDQLGKGKKEGEIRDDLKKAGYSPKQVKKIIQRAASYRKQNVIFPTEGAKIAGPLLLTLPGILSPEQETLSLLVECFEDNIPTEQICNGLVTAGHSREQANKLIELANQMFLEKLAKDPIRNPPPGARLFAAGCALSLTGLALSILSVILSAVLDVRYYSIFIGAIIVGGILSFRGILSGAMEWLLTVLFSETKKKVTRVISVTGQAFIQNKRLMKAALITMAAGTLLMIYSVTLDWIVRSPEHTQLRWLSCGIIAFGSFLFLVGYLKTRPRYFSAE